MSLKYLTSLCLLAMSVSKLIIYSPNKVRDQIDRVSGEIKSSISNFGITPYGHSVIGNLWIDPKNIDGCDDF